MKNFKEKFLSFFKKWPSKGQWKRFFVVLTKKELIFFLVLLIIFIGSGITLLVNLYFSNSKIVPAQGGVYREAVVGTPRYLNPVYAQHSDVDRDLTELLFSGLLKYNEKGELTTDLAKDYEVLENGSVFRFYLKENIKWHDGEPLTAEDVVFTIETIQDPNTKSHLRPFWVGIEVEQLSKYSVEFRVSRTSSTFLQNCTVKIIPKHIWNNIAPENFALSDYNLNPVGSGPYELDNVQQNSDNEITKLSLVSFDDYYDKNPYIPRINFDFVDSREELVKKYQNQAVDGYGTLTENLSPNNESKKYHPSYPQYFALFFNTESDSIVGNKDLRKALNFSLDKESLTKELGGEIVNSPILPKVFGFKEATTSYPFDKEKALTIIEDLGYTETNENGIRIKSETNQPSFQFSSRLQQGYENSEVQKLQECLTEIEGVYPEGITSGYFGAKTKQAVIRFQEKYSGEILEPWGYTSGTGVVGETTREKLNEICYPTTEETTPLEFTVSIPNEDQLKNIAENLKKQWKDNIGLNLKIATTSPSDIEREVIKPREYESLLFGEMLSIPPDPFPYWHSSQTEDPGLNLSLYENEDADELLEDARETLKENERKKLLEDFQEIVIEDAPAVFLYSSNYYYYISPKVKGVDLNLIANPAKRFTGITDWYINTKRVLTK